MSTEGQSRKIVRIIARLNIGGPAIHVILLTRELNRGGYQSVLIKGSEGSHEGDMTEFARSRGVTPVVIPELSREIAGTRDFRALWKIYRLLLRERPDIVHTHTAKAGALGRVAALLYRYGTLDLLRLRPRQVRIFHTFHGHVLSGYFGPVKSRLFVWVERLLARLTDQIITVSQGLKDELVSLGIARPGRIVVVPLGLELEPFRAPEGRRGHLRARLGISEKEPLVGIVGRLVPIKRHEDFLQAARLVLDRWDDGPLPRFVIVGDGEARPRLERMARELALEPWVRFLGFCTDLPGVYADLDLLVLCSLNEGTPVAIIEALAAGVPVVATAVGGVGDVVVHGETGLLVPPRAPDALAEAILRLLRDEALRRELAREGSARVLRQYQIQRLVRDLVQLYQGGEPPGGREPEGPLAQGIGARPREDGS